MTFKSETELCAAFIKAVGTREWTAYPETGGFDILLSRNNDGFQIGIEAKLRLNAQVLAQALEEWGYHGIGPDCRAVLVPQGKAVAGVAKIAEHLALTVLRLREPDFTGWARFQPSLPSEHIVLSGRDWHELCPAKRTPLPDYVPDVEAGASSPLQLTDWKIKAIKIAIILASRGYVTRRDFKELQIDIRRWIDGQWLAPGPQGFVRGRHIPDFSAQHPTVYREIEETAADWMPVEAPKPQQEGMQL